MTFTEERHGEVLILRPSGRIDTENSKVLLEKITQVIDEGVHNLLLDLSAVPYINSLGLRTLITAAKRLANSGGKLVMAEVDVQVRKILEISGLTSVLGVHSTKDEALGSFR
jgi:stage II sporulation protein AA (anti-sigma F factor antagonist)